jgi:hypothetical protein
MLRINFAFSKSSELNLLVKAILRFVSLIIDSIEFIMFCDDRQTANIVIAEHIINETIAMIARKLQLVSSKYSDNIQNSVDSNKLLAKTLISMHSKEFISSTFSLKLINDLPKNSFKKFNKN